MIENIQLPKGWGDKHHTLYYKRWYLSREVTTILRESSSMIVPMSFASHRELHDNVPPEEVLPSDILAGYALHVCDEIARNNTVFTRLGAFEAVRNELYTLGKTKRRITYRKLADEALRYVDFFDRQREYMSEPPRTQP